MTYAAPRRFTPEEVRAIRKRMENGESSTSLLKDFKVSRVTLWKIRKGTYPGMRPGTKVIHPSGQRADAPPDNVYNLPDELYDVLVFVHRYIQENGVAPLYSEIAASRYLAEATVCNYVQKLARYGFVQKSRTAAGATIPRSIKLTEKANL